jgi:hypothetical protein
MQKFDTPAPVQVVLDVPAGRVSLIASDRSDTAVEVLPADAGKSRDVKAAERIQVAFDGGTLRIEAGEPKNRLVGHPGAVEVTVQLPAGSGVEAKGSDTEIRGVGRLGAVNVTSDQGTVKLDESEDTRVAVLAGDVLIGRLTGAAEISTSKGDIRIAEAHRGKVALRTEMGAVEIAAARGVSATLDAGTGSGRIDNALRNAEGAGAGLNIHATTGYGDVVARSL